MQKATAIAALAIILAGCTAQQDVGIRADDSHFVGFAYRQILKAERVDGALLWGEGDIFNDPEQCWADAEGTTRELMKDLSVSIEAYKRGEQALPPFKKYTLTCERIAMFADNPEEFPLRKPFPLDMPVPHWVEEE